MIIRRLIMSLAVAAIAAHAGQAVAQGAFPAPLPGQTPLKSDPALPPVNGAAPAASVGTPSNSFPANGTAPISDSSFERTPAPLSQAGPADECSSGFGPLREDAEKRGKMIKAASDRHAPPDEACKLIGNYSQAEMKLIKYVESHATCGIPPQIADQLKAGHKNTENMQQKVCAMAQQVQQRGSSGPTGDFWTLPEKQL
ncbi:MAG: hypothetical protein QOJ15_4807 [Bradyrhizobium sp.]|nr:hypothetical protein [Bradyrhizobium sp.]